MDNENKCTKCEPGCYLVNNGESCDCIEGCTTVNNENKCIKCEDGYTPNESQNQCEIISEIENCISQEKGKNECKKCKNHYVLSTDKKQCKECDDEDDTRQCDVTIKGCNIVKLINNQIICYDCQTGLDLTTNKDQCTENGLYKASNGQSIDRNSEIPHCINYKTQTVCSLCLTGYYLINGKCYECPEPYAKGEGDGKICFLKHLNCQDYDNKGNCIQCNDGYIFTRNNQYCIEEGTKDPTKNNSCSLSLNIILLMIFILL